MLRRWLKTSGRTGLEYGIKIRVKLRSFPKQRPADYKQPVWISIRALQNGVPGGGFSRIFDIQWASRRQCE